MHTDSIEFQNRFVASRHPFYLCYHTILTKSVTHLLSRHFERNNQRVPFTYRERTTERQQRMFHRARSKHCAVLIQHHLWYFLQTHRLDFCLGILVAGNRHGVTNQSNQLRSFRLHKIEIALALRGRKDKILPCIKRAVSIHSSRFRLRLQY